jgi:hypothetical protein
VVSLVAAAGCLLAARRRPGFAWATAAFTNASLRLFPLAMDVARALRLAPPFSDEGVVARAVSATVAGRLGLLALPIVASLLLTVLAARAYRFGARAGLKALAVYLLSLLVGIGVVIVDELLS